MSKEAAGSHGQILGSLSYFSQINQSTFWSNLPHSEGYDYNRVLREIASRADSAISTVYDDLQKRRILWSQSQKQAGKSLQNR